MIAFIKGNIEEISEDTLILETGNIGYQIKISSSTAQELPAIGSKVKIHTYLHVREDAMQLYGFLTKDDLKLFILLIGVNGIGPKGALAVLSVMNGDALRIAILSGDAKSIAKAPGVGIKTAQRVLLDLKDKVSLGYSENEQDSDDCFGGVSNRQGNPAEGEAVEALTALGYSTTDAYQAIKKAKVTQDASVEEILKMALKHLTFL